MKCRAGKIAVFGRDLANELISMSHSCKSALARFEGGPCSPPSVLSGSLEVDGTQKFEFHIEGKTP